MRLACATPPAESLECSIVGPINVSKGDQRASERLWTGEFLTGKEDRDKVSRQETEGVHTDSLREQVTAGISPSNWPNC